MSKILDYPNLLTSKLFVGVLAPSNALENEISKLKMNFEMEVGKIDKIWASENGWIAPESYMQEMGENLSTVVFVFDGLWHPLNLAFVKHKTMKIEDNFSSKDGLRKFNINPGMIDKRSMRLASHKPSLRRYKISENVWIEDQMEWNRNQLVPLPHVFHEYIQGKRFTLLKELAEGTVSQNQTLPILIPNFTSIETLRGLKKFV